MTTLIDRAWIRIPVVIVTMVVIQSVRRCFGR